MYKQFFTVLVCLHLSFALYYKPRPLVCPVQQVHYEERSLQAKHIDVEWVPLSVNHLHLDTVFTTRTIPVTSFEYRTVTATVPHLTVTEVVRVETTVPLVMTSVTTVTSELLETQVTVVTSTTTNYHTLVATKTLLETSFLTSTQLETKLVPVTKTVVGTQLATLTRTVTHLFTKEHVHPVPSSVLVTSTLVQHETRTSTFTINAKVTKTVCPSSY